MVQIFVRAFTTIVSVLLAVAVTRQLGDSDRGKVISAVVIACVIGTVEAFLFWAPRHWAWFQRLLDPRSVMQGVWFQEVTSTYDGAVAPVRRADAANEFAVYSVHFAGPDRFTVQGHAFSSLGKHTATWRSAETPMFSAAGTAMTYIFEGSARGRSPT